MTVDSSLRYFGALCTQLRNEPSLLVKQEIISGFVSRYTGDLALLLKLLLPKQNKRVYYLQEKQLIKILAISLSETEGTLKDDLNENGCIAETAVKHFKPTAALDASGWCKMTLEQFDGHLEALSSASNEATRVAVVTRFLGVACSNAVYLYFREVKQDLRLGAGVRMVLGGLHPSAYEIFQQSADIQEVVRRVKARSSGADPSAADCNDAHDGGDDEEEEDDEDEAPQGKRARTGGRPGAKRSPSPTGGVRAGTVAAQISVGIPLAPMLAAPSKGVEHVLAKCPNGAFSEVKYDGERIQIHKKGDTFKFFARSLRVMKEDKYEGVESYLRQAITANDCILDGEILLVDLKTSLPLPFGTLGKHKKQQFSTACPCVFLFDILYKNGKSLLKLPMAERREEMKRSVRFIPSRVMISEMVLIQGNHAQRQVLLQKHLQFAIAEGLEGLVIKDVKSIYEPRARHWIKLKKDYLDGMADSADLLALGAWYGSGSKGGILSTFLMGVIDKKAPAGSRRFKTVCKVGNGFDDATLTRISNKFKNDMQPVTKGAGTSLPSWIDCQTAHIPDMILKDPQVSVEVWEIIGAEFTTTKTHTAGISMRFPRVLRERHDKDMDSATSLEELHKLYKASKEKLSSVGLPENLAVESDDVAEEPDALEENDSTEQREHAESSPRVELLSRSASLAVASDLQMPSESTPLPSSNEVGVATGDVNTPRCLSSSENVVLCHAVAEGGMWSSRGTMGRLTTSFGGAAQDGYDQLSTERCLGDVIVTEVSSDSTGRDGRVVIATMIAQMRAGQRGAVPQADEAALLKCLRKCATYASRNNASMHIARLEDSTGIKWDNVSKYLGQLHATTGVRITVYSRHYKKDELPKAGTEKREQPRDPSLGTVPPSDGIQSTPAAAGAAAGAAASSNEAHRTTPPADQAPRNGTVDSKLLISTGNPDLAAFPVSRNSSQIITSATESASADLVSVFNGCTSLAGVTVKVMDDIAEMERGVLEYMVQMLGGSVLPPSSRLAKVTHAVTNSVSIAEKCGKTATYCVRPRWIEECFADSSRYPEPGYAVTHPPLFSVVALVDATLQASRRQMLEDEVRRLGGTTIAEWRVVGNAKGTHFVTDTWSDAAQEVYDLGGVVIRGRWVEACYESHRHLEERPYYLSASVGIPAGCKEIMCGMSILIGSYPEIVAKRLSDLVQCMGGTTTTKTAEALYAVVPRSQLEKESISLSLRYRSVHAQWILDCADKQSLLDPMQYLHSKDITADNGNELDNDEANGGDDSDDGAFTQEDEAPLKRGRRDRCPQSVNSASTEKDDSETEVDEEATPAKRPRTE